MVSNQGYAYRLSYVWLCLLFVLVGCQGTVPSVKNSANIETVLIPKQIWEAPVPIALHPTFIPKQDKMANWGDSFRVWMATNYIGANDYVHYLRSKDPIVPPLDQLLRSAVSYERCMADRYLVPYFELWPNMVPTIALLNTLQTRGILYDFEITSGYRSPELNACVGGARASKHMFNAALDIRLLNEQETPYGLFVTKQKLCDFWANEGGAYNMGLGIYSSGIIHIDTQGWRTWGPNYSASTSICVKPA